MDELDYAIFRHMAPEGVARFWGSRRIVDPRISAREIAGKVGLSEAGVRLRLRALEQEGYLRGRETWVNPSLFGAGLVVADVPIHDPSEVEGLLGELALMDGVTFARDILDDADRKVRVFYVSENPTATARRTAWLRRIAPGRELRGPSPYWIPPANRALSPLDWRLLRVFRGAPDASVTEWAAAARVSAKTTALRFRRLLESRACWWTPNAASEEVPLALLTVTGADRTDPVAVARAASEQTPGWMPVAPDGLGIAPTDPERIVAGLVPADSPVRLERAIRRTLAIPGVQRVRRTFALGSASYPSWTEEQLAAKNPAAN